MNQLIHNVMSHPLEEKIVALQRRVRWVAAVYAVSVLIASVLGAMAVLGLTDYLLRIQDRGLRIIASLVLLGVMGWMAYRYLYRLLRARPRNIDLARLVQRRFSKLGDRLVSAVEFLHQPEDDPAAGSVALRGAVIAEATVEAERLDFAEVLDLRPTVRAAAMMAAVCIVAGLLAVVNPAAVRIAVVRLANPFGNTAWPRANHLALRQPVEQVARGQAFEVEAVDLRGAPLPREVRIHYRFLGSDGSTLEESEPMRLVDGAAIARRENVLRPFSYRAEGGDDRSMPWFDVEVVEPPAVESLSSRLIPPAYTGWPSTTGERHIRGLVGTTVHLAGKANRPLRSAVLCMEGGTKIPAQLSEDGLAFAVEFVVEKSGSYWFELTDRRALRGGSDDRWEIVAVPDAPPSVNIETPTANLFVTPTAAVRLRVSAKDDLALKSMAIAFRQGESAPEGFVTLFEGPEHVALAKASSEGDRRVVDYRWELGPLELKPGAQLGFYATASDYRPQTGKSEPRRLIVITPAELQDRLAGREKLIVAELERALKMQRGCRTQIDALQGRLGESSHVEQADVDNLQAAQNGQHDATRLLTSRSEGVPMHVLALLADLENNRTDGGDLGRRMAALLAEIGRLEREHLPEIERGMTAAVKTAQAALAEQGRAGGTGKTVAASLADVAAHQDAVIAAIERLLGQLSQGDGFRRFQHEMGQLFRDQEELTRRTSELGRRTLTRELRDLTPQEIADLKGTAGRQLELARRLDRVLQEMEQAASELGGHDPSTAKTVAEALDEARRAVVSEQMRAAGGRIQQNQMGQAAAGQKQIIESLQEVLDILANRRQQEAVRLDETIRRLRHQQEAILDETKRFDKIEKSQGDLTRAQSVAIHAVAQSQHKLAADTARLAKRLAGMIAQALADATGEMGQVGQLLDRRQVGADSQTMQIGVMRRLDRLLEGLKSDETTAHGKDSGNGQDGQEGATQPRSAAQAAEGPSSGKAGASNEQRAGKAPVANRSSGSSGGSESGRLNAEEMRAEMKRLWGQLPEHMRQQMQELPGEDFPPKYELLIEEYFRRLAEEKPTP